MGFLNKKLGIKLFIMIVVLFTVVSYNSILICNTSDDYSEISDEGVNNGKIINNLEISINKAWNKTCGKATTQASLGPKGGGIVIDSKNNSYVFCTVYNNSHTDFNVLKYSPNGNLIWNRTYAFEWSLDEYAYDIAVNLEDEFAICGYRDTGSDNDILVAKINENGGLLWYSTFGKPADPNLEIGYGVAFDSEGSVYVCGTNSSGGGHTDSLLVKFNSFGIYQWNRSHDGGSNMNDAGFDIAISKKDIIYITGYSIDFNLMVLNYTKDGTKCWSGVNPYIWQGSSGFNDRGYGIAIDSNNTIYVTGQSFISMVAPFNFMVLIRLTGNLTEIWVKQWKTMNDLGRMVCIDKEDYIWVLLNSNKRSGTSIEDVWLTKYNKHGVNLLNETWYNRKEGDWGRSMAIAPDGNIYITGNTTMPEGGRVFILKYAFAPSNNFEIYTNAGNPDLDGSFRIYWMNDTTADNYSIYQHINPFTDVKEATQIVKEQRELSKEINDLLNGVYYFRVVASNIDGNGTSKQIQVTVNLDELGMDWSLMATKNGRQSQGFGVAVDSENNTVIAGYHDTGDSHEILVAKYDTCGEQIWNETWSEGDDNYAHDVAIDSQDNIYVTGYATTDVNNLIIIKYDKDGNLIWSRIWDGLDHSQGWGIAIDSSDDVYACGTNKSEATDILVVKYSSSGVSIWNQTYDQRGSDDAGYDIAIDSKDFIYVTGFVNDASKDIVVLKYNKTGHENWTESPWIWDYKGLTDEGHGIAINKTDDIFIVGKCESPGASPVSDIVMILLNTTLNDTWIKPKDFGVDQNDNDIAQNIAIGKNGELHVIINSANSFFMSIFMDNGTSLLNKTWGGAGNIGNGIAVSKEGNIYVVGSTMSGPGRPSIFLREYTRHPVEFTIYSNAGNPDTDGNYNILWTQSIHANTYAIYESPVYINTIADRDVVKLGDKIKGKSFALNGKTEGVYYYRIVTNNTLATQTTSCLQITVDYPEQPSQPGPTIPHYAPGAFILSSTATSPDNDGLFVLKWTTSKGATSYSIYTYTSKITKINSTIGTPINITTKLNLSIAFLAENITYFIIVAKNATGSTMSNCINITVDFPEQEKSWVDDFFDFLGSPAGIVTIAGVTGGVAGTTVLAVKWGDIVAARARKYASKSLQERLLKKGAKESVKRTEKRRKKLKRKKKYILELTNQFKNLTKGINKDVSVNLNYQNNWTQKTKSKLLTVPMQSSAQFDSLSLGGQFGSSEILVSLKNMQLKEVTKVIEKGRELKEKPMYGKKVGFMKFK